MNDIVLYCKSYRKDFLRLKRLYISIQKFNRDLIPFYISTPEHDKKLLFEVLGEGSNFLWVSDEEIVRCNPRINLEKFFSIPGHKTQAIVKSEFWRLKISENYVCLDSDSFFIGNFRKKDFLNTNGDPYTVLHQNKELFQLAINRGYTKFVRNLQNEAEKTKKLFSRDGPNFFCAPAPFIWSSKVWQELDQNFLNQGKETLLDLFLQGYPETLIYGEALLKYQSIPMLFIEPLFKVYHFDWQYYLAKRIGEDNLKLSQNYLGIIYQSNWESELDYGISSKKFFSRILKKAKRFLRYLESYI